MRYLTLVYMQYADGRRPPENDVTMFKTQVEPRANGFTAKFFRRQCSTLISLDTRHWASEFKKSLAQEDKPLVQEELKWFETLQVSNTCKVSNFVACTRPGFRTFMTLSSPDRNFPFCDKSRVRICLSPLFESTQVPQYESQPRICFLLTWLKTSRPLIARLFLFMLCVVLW